MPDPDYGSDPTEGALSDVARSGAREWELEMAAWESDAESLRLRRRSLTDVLWQAMQRGDRVTVTAGGATHVGVLTAVRHDLALLAGGDTTVAVNVGAVEAVRMAPGTRGATGDRSFGSLRAYLGMLEVEGAIVRIVGRSVDVHGRVEVVGEDHVLVRGSDGGRWAVGIRSIAVVIAD